MTRKHLPSVHVAVFKVESGSGGLRLTSTRIAKVKISELNMKFIGFDET